MTVKEIAALAGVSISTVSKIVNNKDDNINIETRNRVLKIVKEYNYSPYSAFKNSSDIKTFIIGVLLNSLPKSNQFINGILSTAQKNGYSILLYESNNNANTELKNITSLCKNNVDGVIWEPISDSSLDFKQQFDSHGIEVCTIDSNSSKYFIDFEAMGYMCTKTLIQNGHSKLGCVTKKENKRSDLFLNGFKKCLFDNSITYSDNMCFPIEETDWQLDLLSHDPTGVICSHYSSAITIEKHLKTNHYRVPYDISIISLRNDFEDALCSADVATIKIPYYEFGEFVCNRLIERCEKINKKIISFPLNCPIEHSEFISSPYSNSSKKIIVVGSINIDVLLNVNSLPSPGQTISTCKHSLIPGGKGANQAVGVAKLNHDVVLIGRVGNDYDSNIIYSCMSESNVDIEGISRDSESETGKAYIQVQNDGESIITLLPGANQDMTASIIKENEHFFENAGYCLIQSEIPFSAVKAAATTAKAHNLLTILKPATMNYIPDDFMEYVDIFIPNQIEADMLCPQYTEYDKKADYFIKKGAKSVIITLGSDGCYIKSDSFTGNIPAASFFAVDTTGAADAFISTLAVYLSDGFSLLKSAKIATYAAGFSVSRQGVIPSLIDKTSLETYIKHVEPELL